MSRANNLSYLFSFLFTVIFSLTLLTGCGGGGGGGSDGNPTTTTDTTAPSSPSISIDSGATSTTSTSVTLTLSATDNVGVTAYYASETSTTPSASASGWTTLTSATSYSATVSFTLSSGDGTKTVYVWFRDAAGNVSASASDSITLTLTVLDTTAPSSPSVSINSGATSTTSTSVRLALSATDNVGVTAYYASETSTTPSGSASGWTTVTSTTSYSATVNFTLSSGSGTKTVYVWFKDSAGNVSASASDSITYSPSSSTIQLPKTGHTTVYGTDDDGTLQRGATWPSPRFTAGTGAEADCITDNLTGLMWVKSPDSTWRTWANALTYANDLSLCGYTDWRLPNRKELRSLINYGQSTSHSWLNTQGFSNVQGSYYWSSTTDAGYTDAAWNVNMGGGDVGYGQGKATTSGRVLPVRAGQGEYASTVNLPETGQTTCYDSSGYIITCTNTGQDGDIKAGVTWPSPRFTVGTEAEADCITDNLTGLMWVKSPSPDITTRTWEEALDYANNLNLCGYVDWRLPNINELESLVHGGQSNIASWLNTQGFSNVQANRTYWWASTHGAGSADGAWTVGLGGGGEGLYTAYTFVLPVRAGQ